MYGGREYKYSFLLSKSLNQVLFTDLSYSPPHYFFKTKSFDDNDLYSNGISITELLPINSLGILSKRDDLVVGFNQLQLEHKLEYFLDKANTDLEVCKTFNLVLKDNDKWDAILSRNKVATSDVSKQIIDFQYRPFDNRKVFYNPYFVARQNLRVMRHLKKGNIGLIICRQGQVVGGNDWNVIFCTKYISDQNVFRRGGGTIFPIYVYDNTSSNIRYPNLNLDIVKVIANKLNLVFIEDDDIVVDLAPGVSGTLYPLEILDYIYAVLHSPTYREKYKEFLKIDFPRIPYPRDLETFSKLVELGGQIREIHLLESPVVEMYITQYPVGGTNEVEKLKYIDGRVYINDTQYFSNVPEVAWNFYIGGYQPAQKWLKDRKGRKLEFEDIQHYQKIIVALTETDRLMREIDKIEIE